MDINKLKGTIPDTVITEIQSILGPYQINTALRLAHFLAQCAHESNKFSVKVENLNYGAAGLLATFPNRFNAVTAKEYERKPEKIANKAYSLKLGNGDEASGEGFKYRGRGYIQLTGKDNYRAFDATVPEDILANPDLVATKYPLVSAAFFWKSNNLNAIADTGANDDIVAKVTKKVNAKSLGLADRTAYFKKFYPLLQ